jgi:inosine/xanthosine triphosphate pyrophosphatase family protein
VPALGFAQEFRINPLLRFGDDSDPQWTWPIPHSLCRSKLHAEIKKVGDELNRRGYCGPDDRGAFIRCVLCLIWPDMESLILEARVEGQLNAAVLEDGGETADLFSEYLVPDEEERTLRSLSLAAQVRYSPLHRAIGILRDLAAQAHLTR